MDTFPESGNLTTQRRRRLCGSAVVVAILSALHCSSTGQAAEDSSKDSFVNLTIENDLVANVDDHYTNGIRLSYLTSRDATAPMLRNAATMLPTLDEDFHFRTEHAVGQSMFTPRDLERNPPDPNDRPYAGWLYYSLGLSAERGQILDQLQVSLGVVGSASFAEQTQKEVHRLINSPMPQGWDYQLKNEPGIMASYFRTWRRDAVRTPVFGLKGDWSPHVGAALGNVMTYAAGGVTVRLGDDLPLDYGVPRVEPSLPGAGFFEATDRFGWYVFAGLSARAVARNIFLDGNTFQDSPSVNKEPLVADLQLGLSIVWKRVRLAYTHVFRSEEFEGQGDGTQFGAFTASFRF